MPKEVTEADKEELVGWLKEANDQTVDSLPTFLNHLQNDYSHDYGTICHAMVAAAMSAIKIIDSGPQGGITGFQAGAVMWMFIREWMQDNSPMKMVKYRDMLYPQSEDKFAKTISKSAWEWIQTEANKNIAEAVQHKLKTGDDPMVHADVLAHWKSIINGDVPFGFTVKED